jgi:UrcA family protein
MFGKFSNLLLSGCTAAAAATLGLSFAGHAGAQTYYDQPSYDQRDSADYDAAPNVGEIVVRPTYRNQRSENGIPTERVYASRVVHFDDLDLSTRWGVRELHARVVRAATDACNELDHLYPSGLYPVNSNDGDCKARAIRHAMADAPIGDQVDTDYRGY